jgi:hypothetical protein
MRKTFTTSGMGSALLLAAMLGFAAPASAYEETACGDRAIQEAQLYGGPQEQGAVRDAVAQCPKGGTIVMLRQYAATYCDLSKAVVDTGYGRLACVKR